MTARVQKINTTATISVIYLHIGVSARTTAVGGACILSCDGIIVWFNSIVTVHSLWCLEMASTIQKYLSGLDE